MKRIIFCVFLFIFSLSFHSSAYLYDDGYGNTIGNIGDDSIYLYDDGYGNTIGNIGDDSIYCYSDGFGTTICN